ncbi:hypothetical protein [Shewanella woodyi]|uniref:hypothetical protein n=1 Tax=Shewanella woodyi TaxID=60961 RepID=UPI0037485DF0
MTKYMDLLNYLINELLQYIVVVILFLTLIKVMFKLVKWGRGMSKGAFLFLAIFPLISFFPIPPPQFKNVEKAKQEQRKIKEDSGDPPDEGLDKNSFNKLLKKMQKAWFSLQRR